MEKENKGKGEQKFAAAAAADVILDAVTEEVMLLSRDFEILYANKALLNAVGLEKSDVIGKFCYKITHHRETPCEAPKDPCPVVECLKGNPRTYTHTHYNNDGKELYVEVSAYPLREEDMIVGCVHVAKDITERKNLEEELKKAVKDWDNIFNSISDFVFILDKDFTITKANFAFAEALNLKPEELIGKKCYEVLHKTKNPCPECPYEMTKKDKLPHSQEVNDPNIGIPLLVTTAPIFDEKREVCGAVHIAKDISVLKKAGKEIFALSKFPSENPSPVLRIAKDGEILYSNKPGLELLANWNVKIGEKAPEKWRRLTKETLESAKPGLQEEEEVKGKLFSVAISPIIEAGYVNLYARDITERKKAEESQKRLVEIIEATPDFIGFADAEDKRILYINEAGRKMCGIGSDEDVTKRKICDVHPEWTNKLLAEEILPTAVRDGVWKGECTFLNIRDRREIPVSMVLSSHKDHTGKVKIFSTISRDITEQKLMYEQMLASEKLAAMGRLVADVAHEINNPLAIIAAGTQYLEEMTKKQIPAIPGLNAEVRMFERVRNATNRCKTIVAGLLTSTRPTRLNLGPTVINKVIKESLASTKYQLKRQKIKVLKAFTPRLPIIEADGQRLNQVFINIITNACDAMPEGGELRIVTRLNRLEAGRKGKATESHAGLVFRSEGASPLRRVASVVNPAIEIEMSNTGEGIRKEDLPKLFDPFFTTKKDGKGVGLGLSISYGIVREHGGSISVTSEKGKGTTFIVKLPVAKSGGTAA
ncbi:MAG: PAS domain S-box protein [Kiritimatiellae bacterium]|nr:PAS domain S-box protein [Verrucomicrobiota bacterium]MCG2679491.1 PAS domain S-box protein [Kiritimatiellia bacterium]